jgi:translation elongation factor P/translation initiation factor 5A
MIGFRIKQPSLEVIIEEVKDVQQNLARGQQYFFVNTVTGNQYPIAEGKKEMADALKPGQEILVVKENNVASLLYGPINRNYLDLSPAGDI